MGTKNNQRTQAFCIGSYNAQHFKDLSVEYVKQILDKCQFLFIQEHCLFISELCKFEKLGSINYHGGSAMREDQQQLGRHHGGCAILWHSNLNCKVEPIKHANTRLCCVKVTFPNDLEALLLNAYMPCDERYAGPNYDLLVSLISDISGILQDYNCDIYIFGGDLNADFSRQSPHVRSIKNLLQNVDLTSGIDHVLSTVDYTFESKGTGVRSAIDHICLSDNMFHNLMEYYTLKSVENTSDHDALICSVDMTVSSTIKENRRFNPKSAWYKASATEITTFKESLDLNLNSFDMPKNVLHCKDMQCKGHIEDIELFYSKLISAILKAENDCIPKTGQSRRKRIPGWNEYVSEKRSTALHFHSLWKNAGRPASGDLASNMRQSRKAYHAAIRFCKREETKIKAIRMAEALHKKDNRSFWQEAKCYKRSSGTVPVRVDNANDPKSIADLFQDKFKKLYTSVPYDPVEMKTIVNDINEGINENLHFLDTNFVKGYQQLILKNFCPN